MLIAQFISQVWDGFQISTDDTSLYDEFIYNQVRVTAMELIRQETDKDRLDASNAELVTNLLFNRTDISESESFQANQYILKSERPLPKIMDNDKFGKLIFNIYTNTGTRIERIRYSSWINKRQKTHTLSLPSMFLRNDYAYIVNYPQEAECLYINFEAFFEDPFELAVFRDPDSCIYVPDLDFNIPGYIARRVIQMVKADIAQRFNLKLDTKNNSQEDISNPQP